MRFRILGPLSIDGPRGSFAVSGRQRRLLLSILLLNPGRAIGVGPLVERMWGAHQPKSAVANLRTYVYELRQLFRQAGDHDGRLISHPHGYELRVAKEELDLDEFRALAARGRSSARSGSREESADHLQRALRLWRGRPLEEFPDLEPNLAADILALEEQYWGVAADWVDAELAVGRHAAVLPHLRQVVAERPLDERGWLQLIAALRAAGRTADALRAYRDVRRICVHELGVEPGESLQRIHAEILASGAHELRAPTAPPQAVPAPPAPGGTEPNGNGRAHAGGRRQTGGTVAVAVGARTRLGPPRPRAASRPEAEPGGPATAPVAAPVTTPVTALPPRPAHLVGRERERDSVLALCGTAGLRRPGADVPVTVSLTGTSGIGKTALAVTLAHQLRQHSPDGQIYVSLDNSSGHPKSLSDVLEELLIILVGPDSVPDGDSQRIALLRRVLDARRMLLVLDDVPNAELVRPLVWSGWAMTIITSRPRLVDLDVTWHCNLEPLSPDEGARLLARAAGRTLLDEDGRAATRIVVACGGLPLGLRIVAGRLVLCPGTSLTQLADQLEEESMILDELAAGDESIRRRLSHEYMSLRSGDRRILTTLACDSSRNFTEAEAIRLTGASPPEVSRILVRLVRENLLTVVAGAAERTRYEVPKLLRAQLREQLQTAH
ncbi:BTAD domain-containing putative transcriptional regulator [Streptomyces sp. B6B3]|uniref:BTAD domain-containing putative transcriptional regulator n=1 Tax=Streptomyces sp. B6B3 TaxID=3153570 RepID=UPI00325C78BB